jgi:hypothetical protein
MRDIAIFFETSLFVLSKTYLAWKMSDYAVHFGLSSAVQTKEKKLHAPLQHRQEQHAALDGAVEERGLATVKSSMLLLTVLSRSVGLQPCEHLKSVTKVLLVPGTGCGTVGSLHFAYTDS